MLHAQVYIAIGACVCVPSLQGELTLASYSLICCSVKVNERNCIFMCLYIWNMLTDLQVNGSGSLKTVLLH